MKSVQANDDDNEDPNDDDDDDHDEGDDAQDGNFQPEFEKLLGLIDD